MKGLLTLLYFIFLFSGFPQKNNNPDLDLLDTLAKQKIIDLGRYIHIIGDKNTIERKANSAIDYAAELFLNEDCIIEVSSIYRKTKKPYFIKQYLNRLRNLNYQSVNIEWYDFHYTSDFKKSADGTYVAVITIYQRFIGRNNDKPIYKDTTKKNITVHAENKIINIGGVKTNTWLIFLGNISVKETNG